MKRRTYLTGLGVGMLAGCLGDGDSPAGTESTGSPAATGDSERYLLSIESAETQTFSLRLNDLGEDVGSPSPSLADLDEQERAVVEAAVDGEYETDDPEPWLRSFVDETPYVQADGSYYAIEHSLPVHVVAAEPVDPADVDGEIASREAYMEAVRLEDGVLSGFARIARDEGFRAVDFHPQLQEFVETYDAVERGDETLRLEYEVEDPGPPYRVWTEPATEADVVDGPVLDVLDVEMELRKPLRAAAETSGLYGVEDPPEGLADAMADHRYVHIDGRYYTAYTSDSSHADGEFDAALLDGATEPDDPAELELQVENTGDQQLTVHSGAPAPFGVLYVSPAENSDERVLLWTDEYEESGHVHTNGRSVDAVNSIGIATDVSPGERVAQVYEFDYSDLAPGTYELTDSIGVDRDGEGGPLPYTVAISVERADE